MTGSFPVQSDTNIIFGIPTKALKDKTIIQALEQVFNELEGKGYKPKFDVTDNQATKPIKEFLKTKDYT